MVNLLEDCYLKTEYREWLTSAQAAEYLGITPSSLFNMVSSGRLPYYKLGRSNRYLVSELRELLLSKPRGVRNGDQIR
jgi:excisionase family DNA binding protein